MDFFSAVVKGKYSKTNPPAYVHYPITWLPIYNLQRAHSCSPNSVITFFFYFISGIIHIEPCTAACFGQMLTVIGATVSACPWLSKSYYSIRGKGLSSLPSQNLLLKMHSSVSKEKTSRSKERTAQLICWLIGWLIDLRASFMNPSFLHFETSVALSSSEGSDLIGCLS